MPRAYRSRTFLVELELVLAGFLDNLARLFENVLLAVATTAHPAEIVHKPCRLVGYGVLPRLVAAPLAHLE